MNFLKKVGEILLKGTQIWMGFAPLISAVDPKDAGVVQAITGELQLLAQEVVTVEAVGQALNIPGPDKFKAAAPLVAQVILQSTLMAHHEIDDEAAFTKACATIGGGMADLLNSLKPKIDTISKT